MGVIHHALQELNEYTNNADSNFSNTFEENQTAWILGIVGFAVTASVVACCYGSQISQCFSNVWSEIRSTTRSDNSLLNSNQNSSSGQTGRYKPPVVRSDSDEERAEKQAHDWINSYSRIKSV